MCTKTDIGCEIPTNDVTYGNSLSNSYGDIESPEGGIVFAASIAAAAWQNSPANNTRVELLI